MDLNKKWVFELGMKSGLKVKSGTKLAIYSFWYLNGKILWL